jgi:hypothetical protein
MRQPPLTCAGSAPKPDFGNDFCLEFGIAATVSLAARGPALVVPVPHIVSVGAQEKMVGIDASTVVAVVKDMQAGGDPTTQQLVGHTMCSTDIPSLARADTNAPISIVYAGVPFPAARPSVAQVDLGPEPLKQCLHGPS